LIKHGFEAKQIKILREQDASDVDTSVKWFADTDKEMKKFASELRQGFVPLAMPVRNAESRATINEVLQSHGAQHVTHFGDWVTEVMR
jgi:hypothetical protein